MDDPERTGPAEAVTAGTGLSAELSYAHLPPNRFQRSVRVLTATRPGAWFFARALPSMDRFTARLSGGHTSIPELFAGLPALLLTTTGRRSKQPRETHLIAVPVGDALALLGTNFGQPRTPTWVLNLEAEPRARVTYRGHTCDVAARPATEAERATIMASAAGVYGGYLKYQQRITGRALRIFVLDRIPMRRR